MTKEYVVFYRVSTARQGKSGLGLEAQKRDVQLFLDQYSEEPFEVLDTFTAVQSGKESDDCPELQEALDKCRKTGAELLCAKPCRLTRDVEFMAKLLKDKRITLRIASMPNADKFQLHIYTALNEQEREFISIRTKQALAVARSRGRKLGGLRPGTAERNEGAKRTADADARKVASIIVPMRNKHCTLAQIATALNDANIPTPRGCEWAPMSVSNALKRLEIGEIPASQGGK